MPVLTDGSTLSAYYSHLPPLVAILSTSFTLTHTVTQRIHNSGVTRYAYTQICVNYGVFLNFGSKTAIIILVMLRFSEKATKFEKKIQIFMKFTQYRQNKWEILFKFCNLLRISHFTILLTHRIQQSILKLQFSKFSWTFWPIRWFRQK